jgi:hypothetical protein
MQFGIFALALSVLLVAGEAHGRVEAVGKRARVDAAETGGVSLGFTSPGVPYQSQILLTPGWGSPLWSCGAGLELNALQRPVSRRPLFVPQRIETRFGSRTVFLIR